jgi:uncharacterized protein YwgA
VNRNDLALTLVSQLAGGAGERYPLDPIRVQKAVFLLTQRGSQGWRSLYSYKPYNWGPYSPQLASDMNLMVNIGLVETEEVSWSQYPRYQTTPAGEAQAQVIWTSMNPAETSFIRSVRSYVTSRSFTELLREVYAEYPEFATASYFSG